jgi:hypothetical protein
MAMRIIFVSTICVILFISMGMIGLDGGGKHCIAGRETPNSKNQRKKLSAKNTSYASLPLAA